jgi:hypothetical protein
LKEKVQEVIVDEFQESPIFQEKKEALANILENINSKIMAQSCQEVIIN